MDGLFIKAELVDGNTHTFPLTPRIIVGFEMQYGKGFAKLLGDDQKYEHLCWLAHKALSTNGVVVKPWNTGDVGFLTELKSAELVSDPSSESTETA